VPHSSRFCDEWDIRVEARTAVHLTPLQFVISTGGEAGVDKPAVEYDACGYGSEQQISTLRCEMTNPKILDSTSKILGSTSELVSAHSYLGFAVNG